MSSLWKPLSFFLCGLLLGGAAVGFGIHYTMKQKLANNGNSEHILNRLSEQLNLTEGQKTRVNALLKENAPKMDALRKDMETKSHALWMKFDENLRPLLDPDQKKKLDSMEAHWRDKKGWRVGVGGVTYKEDGPVTGQ